tara:strand:+ start:767 stop:973 length:207 start_codon:yes stop_codon:yes gene_type:complete
MRQRLIMEHMMEQIMQISQRQQDIEKRIDEIENNVRALDDSVNNSCDECGSSLDGGRCYRCDDEFGEQ